MKSTSFLIFLAFAAFAAATQLAGGLIGPDGSLSLLRTAGFSQMHVVSKRVWFVALDGCGRDDSVEYSISAVNPAGRQVVAHVCDGFFIGATLRSN